LHRGEAGRLSFVRCPAQCVRSEDSGRMGAPAHRAPAPGRRARGRRSAQYPATRARATKLGCAWLRRRQPLITSAFLVRGVRLQSDHPSVRSSWFLIVGPFVLPKSSVRAMAVADFDGDGYVDIAACPDDLPSPRNLAIKVGLAVVEIHDTFGTNPYTRKSRRGRLAVHVSDGHGRRARRVVQRMAVEMEPSFKRRARWAARERAANWMKTARVVISL
jgi:hypothetical protein